MTLHPPGPDEMPRPVPGKPLTPQAAALEALAHTRHAALYMQNAAEQLERIAEAKMTPPEHRAIALTSLAPVHVSRSSWEARSLAVLNPNAVAVCIGVGGTSATFAGRAIVAPANSLLVLPIHAYDVELGVDPSQQAGLAAGDAIIQLFRFEAVQAFFLAKLN